MKSDFDKPLTLWTIQPPEVVTMLEREGVFIANAGEPEAHFSKAFAWMEKEMTRRIGPNPHQGRSIWAWHSWKGGRPDLRFSGLGERGQRFARIEFIASAKNVLLSDHGNWHRVLNDSYLGISEDDEEAFYAKVGTRCWIEPIDYSLRVPLEASWQRIFIDQDSESTQMNLFVQATLWELPISSVRDITWFIAK